MLTDEIKKEVLNLKSIDRIHLVEILMESLDQPDPAIESAWVEESEKRYEAFKAGELRYTDIDDIKSRYTS